MKDMVKDTAHPYFRTSVIRGSLLVLFILWWGPALAAPEVTVKARVTLRIIEIQRQQYGAMLLGELRDKDLHTGIPARTITLGVLHQGQRKTYQARTDRHGRFRVRLPSLGGSLKISARFDGDRTYAAEIPAPRTIDVSRQALDLRLSVEEELDASAAHQVFRASTRAGRGPVSVPLTLRNEAGALLARVKTGQDGIVAVRIPTAQLGRPGPLAFTVIFQGDEAINPLIRRFETVLVTPVRLTLQTPDRDVPADGDITLHGELRDVFGPVRGAAISIFAMGRHAASVPSDRDGRFSLSLDVSQYPAGALDLQARYSPRVVWRNAARSRPLEITVHPPRPIPAVIYLIPPALTIVVLLILATVRFWPALRQILGRIRRRQHHTTPTPSGTAKERSRPSGVHLSRPTLRSLMTQAHDISGEVWDAVETTLLPRARVDIAAGEIAATLRTDSAGRFRSKSLPPGTYSLRISLQGYVSETIQVSIPHRGSLHGIRVDLLPVRVMLLEIYKKAAFPLLPREDLWARWTPRELLHHLGRRSGRRSPPMEQLTDLLEHTYWSPLLPEEELVRQARELVDQI